eukprot:TRINITY_DN6893_c0_g1_i6.p1 TRINITY_DN6893_c0_g1~~TRINITY_DN6893_c0_g1_i6.p1  ORF type:complete len:200 (+),score=61.56 TRINITY_DN6893_c0_g1_i6:245-844(+)
MSSTKKKRGRSKAAKSSSSSGLSADGPKFVPPINIGKKMQMPSKGFERKKSFTLNLGGMSKAERAKRSQSSGHGRSDHDRWHLALIQASSCVNTASPSAPEERTVHSFMSPFQWSFLSEENESQMETGDLLTDRSARRRGQMDVKLNFMALSDLHINHRTFNPALFQTWHDSTPSSARGEVTPPAPGVNGPNGSSAFQI